MAGCVGASGHPGVSPGMEAGTVAADSAADYVSTLYAVLLLHIYQTLKTGILMAVWAWSRLHQGDIVNLPMLLYLSMYQPQHMSIPCFWCS